MIKKRKSKPKQYNIKLLKEFLKKESDELVSDKYDRVQKNKI